MGQQAQLSSLLAELHRVLASLSTYHPPPVSSVSHPSQLPLHHHFPSASATVPYLPTQRIPPLNPIPRSTVQPQTRTFTDVVRESILSQPVTRRHHTIRPTLRPNPQSTKSPPLFKTRVREKLDRLRNLSKKGEVCFRCGDTGHSTTSCRNPVICFVCRSTGYKSFNCPDTTSKRPPDPLLLPQTLSSSQTNPSSSPDTQTSTIAMLPPPNFPLLTEANTLSVLRYYATPGTTKLRETLSQGLILHDTSSLGPLYIQDNLHLAFPYPQWTWIARKLPDNQYFVLSPDPE